MPGRRNPKWIALGIVALCLGGLLSYVIYARVATETTVVSRCPDRLPRRDHRDVAT